MIIKKDIVSFLRKRCINNIWGMVADLLIKIGGVRVAAYLTCKGIDWGRIGLARPTILCIIRDASIKDITELRKRTNLNYPSILGGFSRFQQSWFPLEMQEQTFYQKFDGLQKSRAIRKSTEYALSVIKMASKVQKIDVVMSANFDYWQDSGFKLACRELNIPFLVLCKEAVTIPIIYDMEIERYKEARYKFQGTAMAVGNEITAELYSKNIINKTNIEVTGLPRFDAWRDIDVSIPLDERPYITLLTYTAGYNADNNFKDVLKVFASESLKYQKIEFIVKCKNYDDKIAVEKILSGFGGSRLRLTFDTPLFELLPKSKLVINYNSLSMIEAVLAKAKLIIPDWGDCRQSEKHAMCSPSDPIVSKAASFATTPVELANLIKKSITEKNKMISDKVAQDFLNKFFYMPRDKTVSQKVEEFIIKYLNK